MLKRDAVGRVRTSVRQREALLDEHERGGLTVPKFAAAAGVCYHAFAGCMQKRRRARDEYDMSAAMAPSAQTGASEGAGGGAQRGKDAGAVLAVILSEGVRMEREWARPA